MSLKLATATAITTTAAATATEISNTDNNISNDHDLIFMQDIRIACHLAAVRFVNLGLIRLGVS